jgi:hypothetical protein
MSQGIWFVHRSQRGDAPEKRVRVVEAPSVLGWFQAKIEEARISIAPGDLANAELGGPVRGLTALFEAAKKHSLHTPKTGAALAKLFSEHGGAERVRIDARSVLAESTEEPWIFFDERWKNANEDRAAALLDEADASDPFAPLLVPAPAKATRPKAPPKAKREKSEKPSTRSAARDEQAWKAAVGDREAASAVSYAPTRPLDEGALVSHAKFGLGVVTRAEATKAQVLFRDGHKLLVHAGRT